MTRKDLLCTPEELAERLEAGRVSVLDCRFTLMDPGQGRQQYLEAHIPGAVYVHLDDELAAPIGPATGRHPLPAADEAAAMFRRKGVDHRHTVVVYDAGNGGIAARAWWMLKWLGHPDVRLLDGGFGAWRSSGLPTESGEGAASEGHFDATVQPGWLVSSADVEQGLGIPLVDARAPERFAGRAEPIDPVAGHVPGAINLPFDRGIDDEGRFLDRERLVRLWVDSVGDDDDVAVMCGSGVTACHLAIGALLAGRRMPRLYAGSWSEWIRDPARPVAAE